MPYRSMKFLVDAMLGKLARYLRMCGYDTVYTGDQGLDADAAILEFAAENRRTLLTRDQDLAATADASLLIRGKAIDDQLRELKAAGIELTLDDPTRCTRCNGRLRRLTTGPTPEYAPTVTDEHVWQCVECGQHYWRGSHWDDVKARLASL